MKTKAEMETNKTGSQDKQDKRPLRQENKERCSRLSTDVFKEMMNKGGHRREDHPSKDGVQD
jgi:hypothetical protein